MSWFSFLKEIEKTRPHHEAIIDEDRQRRLSYRQLNYRIRAWVNFLDKSGVKKGDRVAILATNRSEHIELLFACAMRGAILVPLNYRLSTGELQEIVERVSPSLFCYSHNFKNYALDLNCFEQNLDVFNLEEFADVESIEEQEFSSELPCLMLFTSGSTGRPKGVLLNGRMIQANQGATVDGWGLLSNDCTMVETPFFHTGGYNVLCLPLLSLGAKVVLASKFDVDNVYETIEREGVSVYFGVPTMFQMIEGDSRFKNCEKYFKSLRFLVSGGAHCPEEMIYSFQKKGLMFKQGFGLTEVGPNCFLLDEKDAVTKVGSIGRPMPHSEVRLVDEQGNDVAYNNQQVGELLIKGEHLCSGYYNDEKTFKESLDAEGYFHTGDLAKRDEEGFYYIVGRKKEMYISGGENVYPAEVERKLRYHLCIDDAVVVAVDDEKWNEVGFCFYRPRGNKKLDIFELREFLNPILSRYKHPHYLRELDEFPLLASGKIDRQRLAQRAATLKNNIVNKKAQTLDSQERRYDTVIRA